jgi:hypothetical protein
MEKADKSVEGQSTHVDLENVKLPKFIFANVSLRENSFGGPILHLCRSSNLEMC